MKPDEAIASDQLALHTIPSRITAEACRRAAIAKRYTNPATLTYTSTTSIISRYANGCSQTSHTAHHLRVLLYSDIFNACGTCKYQVMCTHLLAVVCMCIYIRGIVRAFRLEVAPLCCNSLLRGIAIAFYFLCALLGPPTPLVVIKDDYLSSSQSTAPATERPRSRHTC